MFKKIINGCLGLFLFITVLTFFVIVPIFLIIYLIQTGQILWTNAIFWISILLLIFDSLSLYLMRKSIFLECKMSDIGIRFTYFWKCYREIRWDEITSVKIFNVKGNMVYYIALLYGPTDNMITSMHDVDPLKIPCVGFLITVEEESIKQFTVLKKHLNYDIFEDSKPAREWNSLYNKLIKTVEAKEAKKVERKRLREYK